MLFQPHPHATSSPSSKAGPEALSIYFLFSTSNVTLFSIQTNTNINRGGTTKKKTFNYSQRNLLGFRRNTQKLHQCLKAERCLTPTVCGEGTGEQSGEEGPTPSTHHPGQLWHGSAETFLPSALRLRPTECALTETSTEDTLTCTSH